MLSKLKLEKLQVILKSIAAVLLVSIYPVLYLYAENIDLLDFHEVYSPMIVIILSGLLLTALISMLFRNISLSAVLTSIILLLIFTYGHLQGGLKASEQFEFISAPEILLPIWGIIFLVTATIIVKHRNFASQILSFILVVYGILTIFAVLNIGGYMIEQFNDSANQASITQNDSSSSEAIVDPLPDVYYIILDGYVRSDILLSNYGFDNSEFSENLEDRGFYIADQSYSNYPFTILSVPSTLNMTRELCFHM
jgi:hypothetical protein